MKNVSIRQVLTVLGVSLMVAGCANIQKSNSMVATMTDFGDSVSPTFPPAPPSIINTRPVVFPAPNYVAP